MSTDTAARLGEIRERLAKATPGPWYFTASNDDILEEMCCVMPGDIDAPVLKVGHFGKEQVEANWDLCVEAPETEAFLLAIIDQQADENDKLDGLCSAQHKTIESLTKTIDQQDAEIERLKTQLRTCIISPDESWPK